MFTYRISTLNTYFYLLVHSLLLVNNFYFCSSKIEIFQGDVLIENNPWIVSDYFPNLNNFSPVFFNLQDVLTHFIDFVWINYNTDCKEVFQEGLRNDRFFTFVFLYNWNIKLIKIIKKLLLY